MTKLTATDILELQYKARRVGYEFFVYKRDEGYELQIDFFLPNYGKTTEIIFITNENESDYNKGSYDFHAMMSMLDEELKVLKQKEEKAQKRKELIDSLTPEQRELLGV